MSTPAARRSRYSGSQSGHASAHASAGESRPGWPAGRARRGRKRRRGGLEAPRKGGRRARREQWDFRGSALELPSQSAVNRRRVSALGAGITSRGGARGGGKGARDGKGTVGLTLESLRGRGPMGQRHRPGLAEASSAPRAVPGESRPRGAWRLPSLRARQVGARDCEPYPGLWPHASSYSGLAAYRPLDCNGPGRRLTPSGVFHLFLLGLGVLERAGKRVPEDYYWCGWA